MPKACTHVSLLFQFHPNACGQMRSFCAESDLRCISGDEAYHVAVPLLRLPLLAMLLYTDQWEPLQPVQGKHDQMPKSLAPFSACIFWCLTCHRLVETLHPFQTEWETLPQTWCGLWSSEDPLQASHAHMVDHDPVPSANCLAWSPLAAAGTGLEVSVEKCCELPYNSHWTVKS